VVAGRHALLLQLFMALPAERAGHGAAWEWILARHGGDIRRIAQAWGVDFDSIEQFRELHAKEVVLVSAGFLEDNAAFIRHFVGEYQRVTSEAIRRHDPNHLILGCRHGANPGPDAMAAYDRRYVDVLSMNCYRPDVAAEVDRYYRATGLPIINGEFAWTGLLKWNKYKNGEHFDETELDHCRRRGIEALELAFANPGFVGYTWFKSYSGRAPDQPGYGLVTDDGELNTFNADALRDVNARLEGIHAGQLEPRLCGLGKFVP
jgi:hypothetical protein